MRRFSFSLAVPLFVWVAAGFAPAEPILGVNFITSAHAQGQPAAAQSGENNVAGAAPTLKVLFIGNSYTYYNDMPKMLAALAASSTRPGRIQVKEITQGRATLDQLWGYRPTKYAISDEKWDFVVLQEQSALPTTDPERMYKAGREIDAEVKKAGARTVLFLTWAYRGESQMQASLNRAYGKLAQELGAVLAPVGPAWQIALGRDPKIPLYDSDGSHPSPTGSYLAACVFYLALLESRQPCPSPQNGEVSPQHAATARAAAVEAMSVNPAILIEWK